ncbi:Bestrophin, RFP-TM, chloride channel-domain-containing protein [Lyophyllum atratum]|nr:Bestrophin, RFP-TM, chloride channel-domain-containing protein [Lyophyllum atratum]
MVAHNPLFHGKWTAKRFQATVVNDIWPEVLFFTLIATMVTLVSKLTPHTLSIPNSLLTVLGTVLGLVISFRTSSAYERYQDGRKMWTNINVASRNLALMFWIHVPSERNITGLTKEQGTLQGVIEKKTMINLIQAFSVSVKHFLRSEPGVYYQDLYPLLCFLPRYASAHGDHTDEDKLPLWSASDDIEEASAHKTKNPRSAPDTTIGHHPQRTASLPTHSRGDTLIDDNKSETSWFRSITKNGSSSARPSRRNTFDPEKVLPEVDSHHPLKPARNPPEASMYDYIPLLRFFKWIGRTLTRRAKPAHEVEARLRKKKMDQVESNVPLEVCLVLSSYTASLMQRGLLQPALSTGVTNNITMLQDTLANLERIRNTPLPFAYQAHLRMSLWLYLMFLPFQIIVPFGYYTIPGTAFASFLLLGFLEIGQEIENPFNYDLNDLDLDHFCLSLQRDLHEITAYTHPDPSTFVYSAWNQPFAPSDRRSAADLIKHEYSMPDQENGPAPGLASVRRTLVNSWREVDRTTRQN